MLHQFLSTNRTKLIELCKIRGGQSTESKSTRTYLDYGIPIFLDQVIKTLEAEQASKPELAITISGEAGGESDGQSEIGATAKLHGRELAKQGYMFEEVVKDYGDLTQAVSALAAKEKRSITEEELKTFHRCVDNATADAVMEYGFQHDAVDMGKGIQTEEQQRTLAQELLKQIRTATLALAAIRAGNVGLNGVTGAILDLSLVSMQNLIKRSFNPVEEIAVEAPLPSQHAVVSVADFIDEVKRTESQEVQAERKCKFTVTDVDKQLGMDVDRNMLLTVVKTLVENAFEFTQQDTEVKLSACGVGDRVHIMVGDRCDGLPPHLAERMLRPRSPSGVERPSGRPGLSFCRDGIEANKGTLSARDAPGGGCIFTIDLPRHALKRVH